MKAVIYGDLTSVVFFMIMGFLLAALYDFLRIIYKVRKKKGFQKCFRYVGDIIFFMCSAAAVFQIVLDKYNGLFRGYYIVFMGIGALTHRKIICDTFVNSICSAIFYIDSKIVLKTKRVFVKNIKKLPLVKSTRSMVLKFFHSCSKISIRPIFKGKSDDICKDVTK